MFMETRIGSCIALCTLDRRLCFYFTGVRPSPKTASKLLNIIVKDFPQFSTYIYRYSSFDCVSESFEALPLPFIVYWIFSISLWTQLVFETKLGYTVTAQKFEYLTCIF